MNRSTNVLAYAQSIGFKIETFAEIMRIVGTSYGNFIRIIGDAIYDLKVRKYFFSADIRNKKLIILSKLFSEGNLPLVESQVVGLSIIRYFLWRFYLFFLAKFAF
jgi:hypothetical protein